MKSRIVIWTVVGIAVLIGVIFLVSAPKSAGHSAVTVDSIRKQADETEVQVNRLAERIAAVRKAPVPGVDTAKTLGEAERLLVQAREKLVQAKQAAEVKQAEPVLVEAKQLIRKARRALELAKPKRAMPGGY